MSDIAPRKPGVFFKRPPETTADSVARKVDVTNARVAGINQVARYAHMEATFTSAVHTQAERIAPNATEILSLITWAAGMATVALINDMPRKLG